MVYNNSKKGAQGIGTLIIFIALVLVAAVAAGVLITTVGKLQGKAEATGIQVQQKLGTGFSVFEVIANSTSDGQITNAVDTIATSLQLSPGSDAVKLADITVNLITSTGAYSYVYNSTNTAGSISSFGVEFIKGPNQAGYLSRDDTVKINLIVNSNISENTEFTLRFFPGTGNPLPITVITPPAMINAFTVLK